MRQIIPALLSFTLFFSAVDLAYAGDPITIAANAGTQIGKAKYCGFETDEFVVSSARAINHYSTTIEQREKATKQFMLAAKIAMRLGPVVETCSEFRVGYKQSLNYLKQAGF